MQADQVLRAAQRASAASESKPRLVIAGATGALGNEVLRLLVGQQSFGSTHVLAREPIASGMRHVHTWIVPDGAPADWPTLLPAEVAVVLFDPPRLFYQRERALWTPTPQQLPQLAQWLHRCGAQTVAVVQPHDQMRLPAALKQGLASMDEHALAQQGFARLLIVRSAQKPRRDRAPNPFAAVAHWMLSVGRYMVPSSEQPVRSAKVAEFVSRALQLAPPGIHVAAPETVWQAAQGDVRAAVAQWLDR